MEPIPFELNAHLRQRYPVAVNFIEDHWHTFFSGVICSQFHSDREAAAFEKMRIYLEEHLDKFEKIVVFGCGRLGNRIADLCREMGRPVSWFADTYLSRIRKDHMGRPLLSPEQLKSVSPDLVVISSISNAKAMEDVARRHLPETALFSVSMQKRPRTQRPGLKEVIRDINHLIIDNPEKTIVFCCRSFNLNQTKLVSAVKEKGYSTILISFASLISGSVDIASVSSLFDYIYLPPSYAEYRNVMRNISPSCVHYTGHMFHCHDAMLARLYSHAPFIFEYNDMTSVAFDPETYRRLKGEAAAEIEFWCERFVCEHADGIIYKDSDAAFDDLHRRYNISAPSLQFQTYVSRTHHHHMPEDGLSDERPIRLVYAGGVHGNSDKRNDGYYLTRSLLDIASVLTRQGFQFDIYNSYDPNGSGFEDFCSLSEEDPLFNYHPPVLSEELPAVLSDYDYAWYGLDFSRAVASEQFYHNCFGSKFWSYVEAGLPIIISKEHGYMAEMAADLGVGIPFGMEDLPDLGRLIARYDYREMKKNLEKVQNEYSMERRIERLLAFYARAARYSKAKEKIDGLIKLEELHT
jgi:hypothetical protein